MSLARIVTCALNGVDAETIDVEVSIRRGIPRFVIIGLGDSAVREAKDRVESAIKRSGFGLPDQILVNLAPAELRKEGALYDLPIAIAILAANGQIHGVDFTVKMFSGELSLDGTVKPVHGILAQVIAAREKNIKEIYVPAQNVYEASVVSDIQVYGVSSLTHAVALLQGTEIEDPTTRTRTCRMPALKRNGRSFSEVIGQEQAVRALVIAAAGGHNALMIGTPGSGKSMLAERFSNLLPLLDEQEMHEVVKVHSAVASQVERYLKGERPYRNPHHNISVQGLIGGGTVPRPGEISLAHNGVLFLDEFPEFKRTALEALREPLETGSVRISRARAAMNFPARIQLIAAMNPCPCGRLGIKENSCLCSNDAIQRYLGKISGPILDRIDMQLELRPVQLEELSMTNKVSDTGIDARLRAQVEGARSIALQRQKEVNATLGNKQLNKHAALSKEARQYLTSYAELRSLSARSYFRIIKVARTVADLEASETILPSHMSEALGYRALDTLEQYCR